MKPEPPVTNTTKDLHSCNSDKFAYMVAICLFFEPSWDTSELMLQEITYAEFETLLIDDGLDSCCE